METHVSIKAKREGSKVIFTANMGDILLPTKGFVESCSRFIGEKLRELAAEQLEVNGYTEKFTEKERGDVIREETTSIRIKKD